MHSGRILGVASILLALAGVSCGGGGGGGGSNSVVSVVQDLTVDPTGQTTVITFATDPGVLDVTNFDTNGVQVAQTVTQAGPEFTVAWNSRVTPATQVRPLAVPDVSSAFIAVTSSNTAAPTFAITAATQVVGLGSDTISVQFSGPRVIESEAENANNWTMKIGSTTLPLTGSVFTLDNLTQVLSITTGLQANLHANFTLAAKASLHSVSDISLATTDIAGVATGDAVVPTLTSVEQNLSEDEFGRVIDLTFSEAMDPLFCAVLSNFGGTNPDVATTFAQPSEDVLRVTFNNPILPGVNTIDLENIVDAHGNAFVDQNVAVVAGSTVANSFSSPPTVTTVEGQGGDLLEVEFVQSIDPDDASNPAKWTLEIPTGNPLNLANCLFTYDMPSKTLSIELDVDVSNGATFTFEPTLGDEPLDVDGETFTDSLAGLVSGELSLPTVVTARQNRSFDPTGKTLDVTFSEALDQASAETMPNWSIAGHVVQSATLLPSLTVVRVAFDVFVLPGTDTLDVSAIEDLAGNTMVALVAQAVTSTDITAPSATTLTAHAVEGAQNDIVRVTFNDNLLESEIENVANWTLESPVGVSQSTVGATVDWNDAGRLATVTLANNTNLVGGQTVRATFANVHDIANNTISSTAVSSAATTEVNVPMVDSVWVKSALTNRVVVRFTEPCALMEDIGSLTHYTVRNSGGILKGTPTTATADVDQMGVELIFGFAVLSGSDTLDVSGVVDLAGNSMFPVSAHAVAVENAAAVTFDAGSSSMTTVSGEANDVVTIVFNTPPSRWKLLETSNFAISRLAVPLDLSSARISYDGNVSVTIVLEGASAPNLQTGLAYDVDMPALLSAQGIAGAVMGNSLLCGGESTAPTLPLNLTRIDSANPVDSVLIQFSEAVDLTSAQDVNNYDLNGGAHPDSVTRVGLTTVRATWNGGVIVTDTVNATVADLAGNIGVLSRAVTSADLQGPLVVAVDGVSVVNSGKDVVNVQFDKPLDSTTGLNPANYGVTNGSALVLSGANLRFNSTNNTVTIYLPAGVELNPAQGITVHVENVEDHAGLALSPAANVGGPMTGDIVPPALNAAFVNYRADAGGLAIDVLFSEDVPASFAMDGLNWTVSGGQTVDTAVALTPSHYRLTLSAPLTAGQTLSSIVVPDMAGNHSGAISIAPTL